MLTVQQEYLSDETQRVKTTSSKLILATLIFCVRRRITDEVEVED